MQRDDAEKSGPMSTVNEARANQDGSSPCPGRVSRRAFIAAGSCCALAALASRSRAAKAKWPVVDVGTPKDFAKDGISEDFIKHDIFVIRHQDVLFAASAVCPHQGNMLRRDPQDATRIVCGGHGSTFDAGGAVMIGPATDGMVRLGISLNEKGRVVVDRNQEFPQDKWAEKGASIRLK
jgi:Rieske Fe-S protein